MQHCSNIIMSTECFLSARHTLGGQRSLLTLAWDFPCCQWSGLQAGGQLAGSHVASGTLRQS